MPIAHADILPYGEVSGSSITGTYQTVVSSDDDVITIFILNSCDEPIVVSLDGGARDQFKFHGGESISWDFQSNKLRLKAPTVQVKHDGVAPSTGSLRVTLTRTSVSRNVP